jgi:hypothetical protein
LPLPSKKPVKRKLKRRSKLYPETEVQVNVVSWIKLQYPHVARHIVMIGNEGKRTAAGHALASRMGLHKFASDLFIAYPCGAYHGAWIEIKKDGWKLVPSNKEHTDGQLAFIDKMRSVGYFSQMCVGFEECIQSINNYVNSK